MSFDLFVYLIFESIRFYYDNYIVPYVIPCVIPAILLTVTASVVYRYAVNRKREPDDPEKREYHRFAPILAPLTVLPLIPLGILYFIVRAILFAGFLVIFSLFLIGLRKPFLLVWWDKFAAKIGDPLLKINTRLLHLAFGR